MISLQHANLSALVLASMTGAASVSVTVELFGVPLSVLLGGFTGSVVALAFLPQMTRKQMFTAVAIGAMVSAYGTLPLAHILEWPEKLHAGLAFFLGVLAHACLTWVFTRAVPFLEKKFGGPQ